MNRLTEKSYAAAARVANLDAAHWPRMLRYALAVLVVLVITVLRSALPLDSAPFLLFMPGTILIGYMLGRGPGFAATILSAAIVPCLFMDGGGFLALSWDQSIGLVLYGLLCFGLVAMADRLRQALANRRNDLIATRAANQALLESRTALEASETFLRSVLESSPDCIKILDLNGNLTFMSERGKAIMDVSDFNKIRGCPWPEFWQDELNEAAVNAIAEARAGRSSRFQGYCDTMAGTSKYWDVAVSAIPGADGKPEKILSISRDITETRMADEERARLTALIEQSTDFIGMADIEGRTIFLNDAAMTMIGLPATEVTKTHVIDYFAPEDRQTVTDTVMPGVMKNGAWEGELRLRNFQTGEDIPVLYNIFPVTDSRGNLLGYGTVTKNITAQKRAEAQQRLLNHELGHRLKNTLAMVQAIANQTLRRAGSLPEARAAFDARLIALGKAQDVLTGAKWESAEIGVIVRNALAPHGFDSGRFAVAGPELMLSARCSLALSLALHELATNAAKYGALSNDTGSVSIAWRVEEEAGLLRFHLTWKESGGPPVKAPERTGFGSFMIERSLSGYFKGTARIDYDAKGVVFALEGPATRREEDFLQGEADILASKPNINKT